MISAIPPPRPVSVNSVILSSPSVSLYQKSSSVSPGETFRDDKDVVAKSTYSLPVSFDCPSSADVEMEHLDDDFVYCAMPRSYSEIHFNDLPFEIHEVILDFLFGERTSGLSSAIPGQPDSRSWVKALRHPRRKALADLALISEVWRELVQSRIYRHSKFFLLPNYLIPKFLIPCF